MKLFLDTANLDEIKKANEMGVIRGVTTNPSIIAREGRNFQQVIREICTIVNGPISVEVISNQADGMVEEAISLAAMHPNIVIKVPMTAEGLKAVKVLSAKGIRTNVTLIFSANQALLAASAGASFVSPFVGRLDDINHYGMKVVEETVTILRNYGFSTEVIAASIRNPLHVKKAALVGAHIATIPYSVLMQMVQHPLTDAGIEKFLADWEKVKDK
ncbi:Transaldolase [Moorella thermoacetica]|uniref:Probable transaldolase n=1 Tax=Neomoorella thermoacetica TaxID=1525 RepID=A0AAC9HFA5_NEOTH|nr:fructose-6-phosphate aldolase [Moorella thermoacetica]AOQ22744.1 Transaldolase [Moorella thermoacetica]TYL06837.1 Transaldolase [Moorella thermoacetica]